MNTFLQDGYEPKKTTGNYFRYEDGENEIRILSSAITFWEYFNQDNKPVRSKEEFEEVPTDIKQGGKIKEAWAFVIYNVKLEKIQIMEVTQRTIMSQILALIKNPKWGDVKTFNLSITKTGKSLETSYSVVPNPKTDAPVIYENDINLEALLTNGDPFAK
jgi:hypothetical protein